MAGPDRTPPRWEVIGAVVLDLDGTLYRQWPVRLAMFVELLRYAALSREGRRTFALLTAFRRQRERLAEAEDENPARRQYADMTGRFGLPEETVCARVEEWMIRRPLRHLAGAAFPAAREFVLALRGAGIKTAVLSDYPPGEKLKALGIAVDEEADMLAGDPARLKPHPGPLLALLERLKEPPNRVLVVGDRERRDGEMARRAGCAFFRARRPGDFRRLLASFRRHRRGCDESA